MLIPLVARIQAETCVRHDEYASWAAAVARLRAACQGPAGVEIERLPSFLDDVPHDQRREALVDLICEHLKQSWRRSAGRHVEDYLPILNASIQRGGAIPLAPAEIIEEEFVARYGAPFGDAPDIAEFRRRFGDRDDAISLMARRVRGDGRFVVLRRAGIGAEADVWEAFDRETRALVALKAPRHDWTTESESWERLAGEARLTSGLDHPGIVNVRSFHVEGEAPVYAMRLVEGDSYLGAIRDHHEAATNGGRDGAHASLWRLLSGLAYAGDAMQYAHARGVVHGDLTPANILITTTGEAAIIDWGSARKLGSAAANVGRGLGADRVAKALPDANGKPSTPRGITGTPEYMAPEQLCGSVDARTDIFGLGAVIYAVLTGNGPYARDGGRHPYDWHRDVRDARFERPRRCNPMAPKSLEAVCLRAMAREPQRRFETMADLAAAIRRCLPDSARPNVGSFGYRTWRRLFGRE